MIPLPQLPTQTDPVHVGQHDIQQDHVIAAPGGDPRLLGVPDPVHLIAFTLTQIIFDDTGDLRIVLLHQQHIGHAGHLRFFQKDCTINRIYDTIFPFPTVSQQDVMAMKKQLQGASIFLLLLSLCSFLWLGFNSLTPVLPSACALPDDLSLRQYALSGAAWDEHLGGYRLTFIGSTAENLVLTVADMDEASVFFGERRSPPGEAETSTNGCERYPFPRRPSTTTAEWSCFSVPLHGAAAQRSFSAGRSYRWQS